MRVKGWMAGVAAGAVLIGAGAAPAIAGAPAGTTDLQINGSSSNGSQVIVNGTVSATPPQCARGRAVELYLATGSGYDRVDSGQTSQNGFFALGYEGQAGQLRVLAPRSRVRVGRRTVTCKRDGEDFGFPPF